MGTHPLAGTYHNKQAFIAHTFKRLNTVLKDGVLLRVTHILVSGNFAAVELEALSTELKMTFVRLAKGAHFGLIRDTVIPIGLMDQNWIGVFMFSGSKTKWQKRGFLSL